MTTAIEYALMAGASYISNRLLVNRFPTPEGWSSTQYDIKDSGFEAISFVRAGTTLGTSSEIVISFAGTDFSSKFSDFYHGNIPLALGLLSDQLHQAADYYLQVKASAPTGATISLTGHSLGGGLASLIAVMFGESATTFDQAPFRKSALIYTTTDPNTGIVTTHSVAQDLRAYLADHASADMLAKLDAYITAGTLAARESLVTNINVQGEILSNAPVTAFDRIGIQADANKLANSTLGVSGGDLHSQALLIAMMQSGDKTTTTALDKTLGQVSFKLPDLLKMIFDPKLFFNDPLNKGSDVKENFLERIVKHEAGIGTALPADQMVTRFTADLWKLAQDGGLTLTDANPTNGDLNEVSKALIAFAMQNYYEETDQSLGYKKELFDSVGIINGIHFAMDTVSKTFATAFQNGGKLNLTDAKGFNLYFNDYLKQSTFSAPESQLIRTLLPYMFDWYVQAGAGGMSASDSLGNGAFMLGGSGEDNLTGDIGADLLVGRAGNDWKSADKKYRYTQVGGELIVVMNTFTSGVSANDSIWRIAA